jgi:3-oxoacyl-[acyl-carrier protein] reductase
MTSSAVEEMNGRYDVQVTGVVGDSSTAEVHDALLAACPEPDIVLLNGEGPSPMPFGRIDEAAMVGIAAAVVDRPADVRAARAARDVRARLRADRGDQLGDGEVAEPDDEPVARPRLGLTGVLKGLSKDVVRHNVTINQLLPERFDTGRQQQMAKLVMKVKGITYDEARAEQVASIKAGRLGRPEEFGDAFAFLCAAQSGYLSGQNLQLDGGSYEGVF